MPSNLVSATLPAADLAAVEAALKTLRDKLPFLVDLNVEDRRTLPKMGDKTIAFVNQTNTVAQQNSDSLPRNFDLDEMAADLALLNQLRPVLAEVTALHEKLDDTMMALGSDAYSAALEVYAILKTSGKGAGLDALRQQMSARFTRPGGAKKPTTP